MVTVAIVDDAPEIRLIYRLQLTSSGFEVCAEGAGGDDAIDIARAHRPDVMLLDMSMPPGIDGLTALPLVLAQSPDTRVVVLSGLDEREFADRAYAQGAAGCRVKLLQQAPLAEYLHELLGTAPND